MQSSERQQKHIRKAFSALSFCFVGSAAVLGLHASPRAQVAAVHFEVASVKPTKTDRLALYNIAPGGRLRVTNFPVKGLIKLAWNLQNEQLDGGPKWTETEGFDIDARAEGRQTSDQLRLMLQSLLAERFRLVMRTESRELLLYELALARPDGRLGPSLRPAQSENCAPRQLATDLSATRATLPSCGLLSSPKGQWTGRGVAVRTLITPLTRETRRFVIDRTALSGTYDVDLEWADLASMLQSDGTRATAPARPDLPTSLNAALEEQLGLRLVSRRGPVPVSIIEQVERPDPD